MSEYITFDNVMIIVTAILKLLSIIAGIGTLVCLLKINRSLTKKNKNKSCLFKRRR